MSTEPIPQDRRRSVFADASAAQRALQAVLPMLECAVRDPAVCGSGFLYIVVTDPALGPADAEFDDAVLLEHAVGDRARWDADYAAFARAKARLSWVNGADTSQLQAAQPHRLREGDSLLGGGVWLSGIAVGVSGAFAWYDEAFALAIAAQLRAVARARHAAALEAGHLAARREVPAPLFDAAEPRQQELR
jgi:hypothetical protein